MPRAFPLQCQARRDPPPPPDDGCDRVRASPRPEKRDPNKGGGGAGAENRTHTREGGATRACPRSIEEGGGVCSKRSIAHEGGGGGWSCGCWFCYGNIAGRVLAFGDGLGIRDNGQKKGGGCLAMNRWKWVGGGGGFMTTTTTWWQSGRDWKGRGSRLSGLVRREWEQKIPQGTWARGNM